MKLKPTLLFMLLATIAACTKAERETHTLDSAVKSALNYQHGTYFVYYDSLAQTVDSFALVSNRQLYQETTGYRDEMITLLLRQYNRVPGWTVSDTLMITLANINTIAMNYLPAQQSGFVRTTYSYESFNYPFSAAGIDHPAVIARRDTVTEWSDTSIIANNHHITDVTAINLHGASTGGSPYAYSDTFYISPSRGILAINLYHPLVGMHKRWRLLRAQVNK